MYDDEEFWDDFAKWARRIAAALAILAAAGGYLYYRRSPPPPSPPNTPQQNVAILRDHSAPSSARQRAAGALRQSDPSIVADLIEELEKGDDDGRFLASLALGSMGGRASAATEAMIRAAHDASPFVRRQVASSLPKVLRDPNRLISSLDPLLHDADVEARRLAFEAVLYVGQTEPAIETLTRLLDDPDTDVRRRAAAALARTDGGEQVAKSLRRALDDEDAEVRAAALTSLFHLEAVDLRELTGMLGEAKLRNAASQLLWDLKDDAQQAIPVLRELLKSDDGATVLEAASLLGAMGPAAREASLDLIALADDGRPSVSWRVLRTLAEIGLESEFQPPELWEQLEASEDKVYSLNLEPKQGGRLPNQKPGATDADLAHLARLHNLRLLTLSHSSVGDAGLPQLANLKNLARLDLESTSVSSAGLMHLTKLDALRSLSLKNCAVDDEGLRHLKKLSRLRTLGLLGTQITDDGLSHLSDLTELRQIAFPNHVTDRGLAHLQPVTGLEEIWGGQFSPQGVARFPNLTSVGLHLPSVTDGDLAPLAQLPHLRTLRLDGTAITDAAVEFLSHLEQLEDLSLQNTAVTDAGLKHLKALTGLKYLHINGKKLTAAGIDDLRKSLPNLRID
jgi:HEAT repeat protein